jgi:hypothetical protein
MYFNQIYQDKDREFYITLYHAEQTETKEVYIVYYKVEDKSKVLVTPKEVFDENFRQHHPHNL